ncbi:MAG: hypothetical protein QOJ79_1036 [Actinomycetota bacterium]|nr:hypothetical protein [Actinomycetota bacterium]
MILAIVAWQYSHATPIVWYRGIRRTVKTLEEMKANIMDMKNMTLRLPLEQAEALELVATVDGKPMSEEIREALMAHVDQRRKDPEFQDRLKRVMSENASALKRLTS